MIRMCRDLREQMILMRPHMRTGFFVKTSVVRLYLVQRHLWMRIRSWSRETEACSDTAVKNVKKLFGDDYTILHPMICI